MLNPSELALLQRLPRPDLPRRRSGELMGPEAVWLRLLRVMELWIRSHLPRGSRALSNAAGIAGAPCGERSCARRGWILSGTVSSARDEGRQGLMAVVRLDDFRRLWIGQIFSQLADKFYIVLMVFLIAQHWVSQDAQSSGAMAEVASAIRMDIETEAQRITLLATGIYVANTVPAVLLGMLAGVWADRWPKRRVMVASNAMRALLVLLAPVCLLPGPELLGLSWGYWALLLMTFLESVLTQFFAPAEQAAIPLLVPKKLLLAANSLYQATSMAATIVGFALGQPILRLLNQSLASLGLAGGEFLLLPFCYGMAALSLSTIRLRETPSRSDNIGIGEEIREGLQVLVQRPTVRRAMRNLVLLYSLLAAMYVLAISLAGSISSLGPTGFGSLLAMSGLGMAIGAVLTAQVGHRISRHHLGAAGLAAITCCLVLLGQLQGRLLITLSLCTLLGIGAALVAIPAQTTLQEDTPEQERGRVFGLQNNLINIALSLPLVLAGTLVSSVGLKPVLLLLAALALGAAVLEETLEALLACIPCLRRIPERLVQVAWLGKKSPFCGNVSYGLSTTEALRERGHQTHFIHFDNPRSPESGTTSLLANDPDVSLPYLLKSQVYHSISRRPAGN